MEKEEKGYNLALKYLTYRPRTIYELKFYLGKKGCKEEIIESTIEKLKCQGYLDDYEYTVNWLNYHLSRGKDGPALLEYKLLQKGVSKDIIKEALKETMDEDMELKTAQDIIEKKFGEISELSYEEKQRAGANLQRKGFSYDTIVKVLDF